MWTVTTTQLSHESLDLRDVNIVIPLETERQNQSDGPTVSKARQATTTFQLSGLNFLSSAVNGIILVSLPTLVAELNLPEQLHVWPISVYGLAVGSTILPVGSLASAAGNRIADLVGCFSVALLLLASGFVKSGEQLVAYHALQGVAMSMHLASSAAAKRMAIKHPFSSVCATMLLSFAVLKSMEQYCSLFFQEVQGLSATETSTRLLPSLVVGIILNFTTGLFVHKVSARWLVAGSSIVCAGGPVLMALAKPERPYWYNAFFAQLLQPISGDILLTVGLIIVSEAFPEDTQALAGAVFNAASQFGTSLGLAIMQVVAGVVTKKAAAREAPVDALLLGYRASFWAMTGFMVLCFALGLVGLHKTGKVGNKKED
ncbi:putative MFS-type transporter [Colletotrichum sp. SAR 10_98]|nr:putative MFS-type transporter [Colletotrichum sp. SAR 10_98]